MTERRLRFDLLGQTADTASIDRTYVSDQRELRPILPAVVARRDKAMVELLLRYGARKTADAFAPALRKDDVEMVSFLLSKGFVAKGPNESRGSSHPNYLRDTPLSTAASSNAARCAELLIAAGADVNAGRRPPAFTAAQLVYVEVLEVLLDHGGNPLDRSCPHQRDDLIQPWFPPDTVFAAIGLQQPHESQAYFLYRAPPPLSEEEFGQRVVAAVKALVEHGAVPSEADVRRFRENGHPAAAEYLEGVMRDRPR